jgi:hypothetical protein
VVDILPATQHPGTDAATVGCFGFVYVSDNDPDDLQHLKAHALGEPNAVGDREILKLRERGIDTSLIVGTRWHTYRDRTHPLRETKTRLEVDVMTVLRDVGGGAIPPRSR